MQERASDIIILFKWIIYGIVGTLYFQTRLGNIKFRKKVVRSINQAWPSYTFDLIVDLFQ